MEIKNGTYIIRNGQKRAIIEYILQDYIIYVFQGELSTFDILIKYRQGRKRLRTPKHIHWVVDILMKMQAKKRITKQFLSKIQICWQNCSPLQDNSFEALKNLIEDGEHNIDLQKYQALNDFGEYSVEFLYVLMQLLATQEKTNRTDAYMFGKIIEELLEVDIDIFKIVSVAGFNGR